MLYVDSYDNQVNYKKMNFSYNLLSDGIHDPIVNCTFQLYDTATHGYAYVSISIPENDSDQEYRKIVFKTVVDCNNFVRGNGASFLAKLFAENYKDTFDFEAKFPFSAASLSKTLVK